MTVILTNNVYSTLAADLASGAGSLVVADGSRFPALGAGEYFYATLVAPTGGVEIVKVVSRIGNALGIVRAQEGTLAQAFPEGSRVELRVTARSVLDAIDDTYQATLPVINAAVASATASAASASTSATSSATSAASASTSASAAASSASSASSSATSAAGSANTASSYAAQAIAAGSAAFINANVYANVAAGLAASSVGNQFQVVINSEIIRYRVDAGPVAVEVSRFNVPTNSILFDPFVPNGFRIVDDYGFVGHVVDDTTFRITDLTADAAVVDSLTADYQVTANSTKYWGIHDEYGFDIINVTSAGLGISSLSLDDLSVGTLTADYQETATGSIYYSVRDEYGFDVFKIATDGVTVSKVIEIAPSINSTWNYENHIILSMGQSLSIGVNSLPIYTATQNYNNKMLSTGVRTYTNAPYTSATLSPLVEVSDANGAETPIGGASDFLNRLIEYENGIAYTAHSFAVLGAATGVGSTPISSHLFGTTIYNRSVDVVTQFHTLSLAANRTAACLGVFWVQGESDVTTAQATYQSNLQTMRSDFSTSVQAVTGQTQPVKLFTYQTSSHLAYSQPTPNSALAQLAAANADPNIYLSTPIYHLAYSDGVHLTGSGSRHLGAYMALAYKRVIIDGLDWKPLQPASSIRQGSVCIITFDVPDGPLILDTVAVKDPGNYGFALVDSGGSPLTISSVSLAGPDRIKIVAASSIPAGAKVRYAWGDGITANSGPLTGPRGCLRDSAGDKLPFDFGRLHNWCVIFERGI